jgi:hypothetical protein
MEKRRSKRTKTYHPARILVRGAVHHCSVFDFTSAGLCIDLPFGAELLSDTFEFSLDNFRTSYVCRTVWRGDCIAGAAFEKAPTKSPERRRAKLRVVGADAGSLEVPQPA